MELRNQLQGTLGNAYSLEHELGGGGMSRVFVATETSLGRSVVVKVLPPEFVVNVDRFRREIRLAARLQHPHIVPVLTAGETSGLPFYTMPLVEGQSLRARLIESGALPMAEAVGVLGDVAKALAYAHEHGVVHRDIKPDNVLLSGGAAVVTDFGIAKAISESTVTSVGTTLTSVGTSMGTPAYMAPEQAAADPATDHRADIYAFGCMAYEVLAGQPPFANKSPRKLLAAQMGEKPVPITEYRADVPPTLASLVMRCLEKDPADRPQSAGELVQVLDMVSTTTTVERRTLPVELLVPVVLGKALVLYVVAFIAVALIARSAIAAIGLPDWVLPGAIIVMVLGLPAVLLTAWVHYVTRRAATETPTLTPRGTNTSRTTLAAFAERARPHVSWRRTTRGGVLALGAFVLLVAGFMTLRALGIGPAGSLLAAGRLSERNGIVVGDFRVSADSSLGRVVTEVVRTGLGESPLFTIMSPPAVAASLRRMQRDPSTWVDLGLAREIAIREGAKAVVTGDVTPLGAGFVVTLRLVSADSGAELASFHETADSPHELLPTLDKLTRHLRGKAGESLKTVHADPPLEQVTTSSLEALRRYVDGSLANNAGKFGEAIGPLQEAIALDTTFAMAYRKLASAYGNGGYPPAKAESALAKAHQYRDRLPERERGMVIGDYFARGPGRDRARAIVAYHTLLARYPDEGAAINNLALALSTRRELARAESLYARGRDLEPNTQLYYTNLLATMVVEGKFAEGERLVADIRRRFPNARSHDFFIGIYFYSRGETDSAVALLRGLRDKGSLADRALASNSLAAIAAARGRLAEAAALRNERRAANVARGASVRPLDDSLVFSFLDIWFREQPERGVRRMEASLAQIPIRSLANGQDPSYSIDPAYVVNTPYFIVATAYALANHPDRARATLAQYDADVPDTAWRRFLEPARQNALGEIALAEQRPLEAIAAFRRGDERPDGPANGCGSCLPIRLARAFDRAGMSDSAIVMFERYLATPSPTQMNLDGDPTYLAGTYKRLGELYEAKGTHARAADYYRKFVALWKTADPELQPKVAEVQRRLARLGGLEGR